MKNVRKFHRGIDVLDKQTMQPLTTTNQNTNESKTTRTPLAMQPLTTTNQHKKMETDTTDKPNTPASGLHEQNCLRIECGHYTNGKGAWMDILDVQMPGYAKYDGGATGVSVKWGHVKWFVLARDEEHFWSQFPYSVLKGCFYCANNGYYFATPTKTVR